MWIARGTLLAFAMLMSATFEIGEAAAEQKAAAKKTPRAATGARKVIRLEDTKIEGRIQKPQAFYILQRSNLNFQGLELKQSFVPKIIRSVEQAPF